MPEKSSQPKTPVLCQPTSGQTTSGQPTRSQPTSGQPTSGQPTGSNTTCSMTYRNTGQLDRDGNMLFQCDSNCGGNY